MRGPQRLARGLCRDGLHPRHAVVAIRSFTGACTFRMGEIEEIDLEGRAASYRIAGHPVRCDEPLDELAPFRLVGEVSEPRSEPLPEPSSWKKRQP